ncbi:Poly(U)-specific endoribonuclease [Zostera marina]|uniref:Poly(U)-specific endoribonuclease n=1 Tax=Zostera marina TaxID=29655 RepID=A0A0K9NQV6_ZOSMR|nr:Poly(U)-specific endoribonuclease [Zostera marina]
MDEFCNNEVDSQSERSATWADIAASGSQQQQYQQSQVENPQYGEIDEGGGDGDWETVGHKKQNRRRFEEKVPVDNWGGYKQPSSDQEYAYDLDDTIDIEPSESQLSDISEACSRLWELDGNRLVPNQDYVIDCGEGKKTYEKEDMASENLFNYLDDNVFRRPTYSRFCSLLDNYNPNQGCREVVTSEEEHEQVAFIEEISRTAPIKYLHRYLVARDILQSGSYDHFKKVIRSLWFDLYGRGGSSSSSSAFEHVFVGEINNREENSISGFHNWIQFYIEEAKGCVDYQGYIFPRRRGQTPDSETQLLTLQFEWNGVRKTLSSTFVGVSPEFEIALYTLCFFVGEENNHVYVGPYSVNIKCYRFGRDKIGSIFPIAEC